MLFWFIATSVILRYSLSLLTFVLVFVGLFMLVGLFVCFWSFVGGFVAY